MVVGGCSAGGHAAILQVDPWRKRLPSAAFVVGLPDSGFFVDWKESPVGSARSFHTDLGGIYEAISASVNSDCVAAHKAADTEPSRCFFAEHTMPFVFTPTFLLQSIFDAWQIENILGSSNASAVNSFGAELASRLVELAFPAVSVGHGGFIDSCSHHCSDKQWFVESIDGVTMRDAFTSWYAARKAEWQQPPNTAREAANVSAVSWQNRAFPCAACCVAPTPAGHLASSSWHSHEPAASVVSGGGGQTVVAATLRNSRRATLTTANNISSRKQLRWYIGNVPRVQEFLLGGVGSNKASWLNTSLDLGAPFTGGVYQCCHGVDIQPNGTLKGFPFNASKPPWNVTAFAEAEIDMYYTITYSGSDPGLVTKAALARVDAFALELLNLTLAYGLAGVHTDWETATDNDLPSWIALWGHVKKVFAAHGKQIAMSVDDSDPGKESTKDKAWSYLTDWDMFVNISDVLINMGGYPLGNHKQSYPAAEKLQPYHCGNANRWCGIEGQVEDMLRHGVDPKFQLQPGISPDGCTTTNVSSNSSGVTGGGWTEVALGEYLDYLDLKGVRTLTIWTSDAFLLPSTTFTCPWFMPMLRNWTTKELQAKSDDDELHVSATHGGALELSFRGAEYEISTAISSPGASLSQWHQLNGTAQQKSQRWTVDVKQAAASITIVGRGVHYTMHRRVDVLADPVRLMIHDRFTNVNAADDLGLAFTTRVHAQSLRSAQRCKEMQLWSHQYKQSAISECIHVAGLYNTSDPKRNYHLAEPSHPSWNPSWWFEGTAPDGGGGLGVIVVSERYKLQLDMSQSAGFSAMLHSPGVGVRAGATSANYSWMILPVRTDYWDMINTARSLLVKKQTLHARVGFMNWGQITTMHRSDLVQYIRARGMRQIVVMGPFSGSPWLGLYSEFLYEPSETLKSPYTNETYNTEKRVEACNILHSIQADVGGPMECLAPFETALTPDLPPGSLIPRFQGGSLSRTQTSTPTTMNNWGPCQASDDPSPACKAFVATHGRSYVYVLETNGSTDKDRGEYLTFVMSKFRPLLAREYN